MIRREWLRGRKGSEQAKKQNKKLKMGREREEKFNAVICTDVIHLAVIKTKLSMDT